MMDKDFVCLFVCFLVFVFFRDFDANLYLCEEAFGLLPLNTFSRLSSTLLFYVYGFVLFLLTVAAVIVAFRNLR